METKAVARYIINGYLWREMPLTTKDGEWYIEDGYGVRLQDSIAAAYAKMDPDNYQLYIKVFYDAETT